MPRKAIDKNIRNNVWRRYWGNNMDGQCWVCGRPIQVEMFECGHIISVSNRGGNDILNLVPICKGCNLGMGEENLLDYKKRCFAHINTQSIVQPESNIQSIEPNPIEDTMTAQSLDAFPVKEEIFGEYELELKKLIPIIKKWIKENKGIVTIGTTDIAKKMVGEFTKKSPTSIYWGLKTVLFNEGIVVGTQGNKDLIMKLDKKKLPLSVQKYMEKRNEEYGLEKYGLV